MLLVGAFLFPLDTVLLHDFCEHFLFREDPAVQLVVVPALSFKALMEQSLFERYTRFQSALAAGGERYKVDVEMGRRFIHMKVSGEHSQIWVALLESLIVFIKDRPCQLCVIAGR